MENEAICFNGWHPRRLIRARRLSRTGRATICGKYGISRWPTWLDVAQGFTFSGKCRERNAEGNQNGQSSHGAEIWKGFMSPQRLERQQRASSKKCSRSLRPPRGDDNKRDWSCWAKLAAASQTKGIKCHFPRRGYISTSGAVSAPLGVLQTR